jgi:hypothetical protein
MGGPPVFELDIEETLPLDLSHDFAQYIIIVVTHQRHSALPSRCLW